MLIELPKNIGKSHDKSYSTDQKTSFIVVRTETETFQLSMSGRHFIFVLLLRQATEVT